MVIFVGPGVEETLHTSFIQLAPYAHQVGGHVGVLALNNHTVCKPHIDQEYQFYKELPRDLKKFVPKFKGIADVVVKKARDGYLNLVACPIQTKRYDIDSEAANCEDWPCGSDHQQKVACPSHVHPLQTRSKNSKPLYRVRLSQGGSLSIDQDSDSDDLFEDMSTESGYRRFGCNPWSMHCHRQQIAKMQKTHNGPDDQSHKFLLLEDVTDQFHHPCILDLKIGVRSYGDDATEAKKQSHMAKVQGTTSAKLGIRACGMQIYRPDKGRYICRNKYYGRRLSEEGLRQAVEEFVFDGKRVRLEVVAAIIKEIKRLMETLSELDSYRFFGSSLLLIYEGSDHSSPLYSEANISPSSPWTNNAQCTHEESKAHSGTQTDQDLGFHEEMMQAAKELDFREDDSGMASDWDSERSGFEEEEEPEADCELKAEVMENLLTYPHNSQTQEPIKDEMQENVSRNHWRTDQAMPSTSSTSSATSSTSTSTSSSTSIPSREANHHKKLRRLSIDHLNVQDPSAGHLAQIKMIDFAHTEFRELSGRTGETYDGPDSDFIFGLENLLRIFGDILYQSRLKDDHTTSV